MTMNTHSLSMGQQTGRGEQLHLLKSFDRFLKLRKSGFPFTDARHMTGLKDDLLFDKAQEIYKNYL
jgi:hypothetical protein